MATVIISMVLALIFVAMDQITKYCIVAAFGVADSLSLGYEAMKATVSGLDSIEVIPGVFNFSLVMNDGAAFGAFDEARWLFMTASTIAILALVYYIIRYRPQNKLAVVSLAMIIGGGIGNMIDRIWLGYVIDFLDFCAFPSIWKWTFNVADSFVCVGTALLIIYILFFYKDKDKTEDTKK